MWKVGENHKIRARLREDSHWKLKNVYGKDSKKLESAMDETRLRQDIYTKTPLQVLLRESVKGKSM